MATNNEMIYILFLYLVIGLVAAFHYVRDQLLHIPALHMLILL